MSTQKPIIIANWKMKLSVAQAKKLAIAVKNKKTTQAELVICPTFASLTEVAKNLAGSQVKLGAQNCFWEPSGAYTGEVSAKELKEIGCEFVIIGHSERRQYLKETDEMIHRKIKMALACGLTPILCVGETFDQRQQGAKDYVLIQQVTQALQGVEVGSDKQLIIAYEPVWVIGSGQAIDPLEAANTHQVIYQSLFDLFPSDIVKNNFRIIYGGSVDQTNVADFVSLEKTSGVLVGGASLKIDEFSALIDSI